MITLTLRRRGGSVVVSLPPKILALLELAAGATVCLAVENGNVVLAPVRRRATLAQGLAERTALERKLAQRLGGAGASSASIGGRAPPRNDDACSVDSTPHKRRLRAPCA